MATFKGTLNTRKSKKGYQIRIRVIKGDCANFHALDLYLQKKTFFNVKSGSVSSKFIDADKYNDIIKTECRNQEALIDKSEKSKDLGLVEIIKEDLDIFEDLDRYIKYLNIEGKITERNLHGFLKTKLIRCWDKEKLSIHNINKRFMDKFYLECRSTMKIDTLKIYFMYFQRSLERIIKYCDLDIKNQVQAFEITAADDKENLSHLDKSILDSLRSSEIRMKSQILVKHSSLFQFYTCGMRVSDLTFAKWSKISMKIEGTDTADHEKQLEAFMKYWMSEDIEVPEFTLSFKSLKTNHPHLMTLTNQALLELRFFLDIDLQRRFLDGDEDRIVEDGELSKICGYVPINTSKYTKEFPEQTYHIRRLKVLVMEQLKRKDSYIFNSVANVDINLNPYIKENKELVKKIITRKTYSVNDCLKRISKELGFETKLTSHDMRHLFTILLYLDCGDLFIVKQLLGHANLDTTERYLKRLDILKMNSDKIVDFYDTVTGMKPHKSDELKA